MWEDTVISNEDIMDLEIPCDTCEDKPSWGFPTVKGMECIALKHREAQAQATYEAMKDELIRQGRREVIEWINEHIMGFEMTSVIMDLWQQKLQEWGLKEG
jgi:hypothetical protein